MSPLGPCRFVRGCRSPLTLACLLAAAFPLPARAANDTWSGASSGNFSTGPWSPGVPGSGDNALFTANGTYTVTFTTSPTNTAFQVSAGNVTFNAGPSPESYTLTSTSFITGGTLTLGATGSAFTLGGGIISVNGTAADLNVASLASLSLTGLNIGTLSGNVGTVTNSGTITLLTTSILNVGTVANTTGILNLTGGTLTTGTGLTSIGAGGKVTLNGGALSVLGDMLVSGGTLTQSAGTGFAFNLPTSHTMTINTGGVVSVAGVWAPGTSDLIAITGAGSTFNNTGTSATADVLMEHNSTLTVGLGGTFHCDGYFEMGIFGNGVITIDGANSSFTAAGTTGAGLFNNVGENATGVLTFSSGATGSLTAGCEIGKLNGSNGTLSILSSASVTSGHINIASQGTTAVGFLNITGGTLTQSGAVDTNIGSGSGGSATLTVGAGGVYNTGTGTTFLNATGIINLAGTLNQNGNLSITGGTLSQTAGTFSFAASHNITIQAAGKLNLLGSVETSASDAISVIGAASQFAVTGPGSDLAINNGATLTVSSSAIVHSDIYFDVASNGNGSASFDGVGTFLTSGGTAADGQNLLGTAGAGTLTFSGGATGILPGGIIVGSSAGSSGTLKVQSAALLTTGNLNVASFGFAATGVIDVTGGTLTQSGSAALFVGSNVGSATLTVGTGGVFNTGTGVATIGATGLVNVAGTLNFNGDILVDGGTITQSPGTFSWAAAHTMTIQGGGLISLPGSYAVPAGVIIVTGTSSQLYDTGPSADFRIINGASVSVLARATLRSDSLIDVGNGTLTVSGLLSLVTASGTSRESVIANGVGIASTVTLSTAATGSIPGGLRVGNSGGSGTVNILSSAALTTGPIDIASTGASSTGVVNVTGGTLTQSSTATLTIGSVSLSTGTLALGTGGIYTTGTGPTTINATGVLQIAGGAFNQNGDLALSAGSLTLSSGAFNWANSHTMTIQSGGVASFEGTFITPTGALINITGTNSQFNATGAAANLRVLNSATVSVDQGGALHSDQLLNIPNGVVTVNGIGSSFSAAAPATGSENIIGTNAVAGSLFFTNSATASVTNGFELGHLNGSGLLSIQSSAAVTSGSIDVATDVSASSGFINVTGGTLTQSGAAHLTLGRGSNGAATLTLGAAGVFTTGTGLITVNPTAQVNLTGGAFNANGDILLNGGTLTQSSGTFTWAANHTMTIQAAGIVSLPGTFVTPANATITVTGAGSQLADIGPSSAVFVVNANSLVSVQSGGLLHSDLAFTIGAASGSGTVTVDGANSSMTSSTSLTAGENHLGTTGFGSLAFSNNSTGYLFNGLQLGSASGSGGSLSVQSNASLNVGPLDVGSSASLSLASVNITGGTLTQVGNSTLTIGAASLSNASVIVGAAGLLTTGSGAVTLNPTANVSIQLGGALNLKGNMSIAAGANFTGTGTLNASANISNAGNFTQSGAQTWAPGSTFTNTAGTAVFLSDAGTFTPNTLTLTVSGGTVRLISFDKLAALTINGGKAVFGPASIAPATSSTTAVSVGAAGTLEFAASYSFDSLTAPTLTGTGTITIDSGVTLKLNVDSAFAGTIIANGTLFLAPALNPLAPTFNFSVLTASPDTAPPAPEPASLTLLALPAALLLKRRKMS